MSNAPAVSLEVALFFTALSVGIVIWVFTRIALDYRMMRRRRETLQEELSPEQFEAWDRLRGTLAVLRDRAQGWSTDDFVAAQKVLEAVEGFEGQALNEPESLPEYADRARKALHEFDEAPAADRLYVIHESLD